MAGPKPKSYIVDGKTYRVLVTGNDEGGNGLATVECDGVEHRNLIGRDWREFIDSFITVSAKMGARP